MRFKKQYNRSTIMPFNTIFKVILHFSLFENVDGPSRKYEKF